MLQVKQRQPLFLVQQGLSKFINKHIALKILMSLLIGSMLGAGLFNSTVCSGIFLVAFIVLMAWTMWGDIYSAM
jgi:hypothetical protein